MMIRSPLFTEAVRRISLGLLLLGAVLLAAWAFRPPPARGLDTPSTEFSAVRAEEHLGWVAAVPRPVGSARLREVRERLLVQLAALGVTPEVQQAQAVRADGPGLAISGTVSNVLARLPGTSGHRILLVVGHYDSVPSGPGAGDNGAAVAAMLETLRALRAGEPLAHDVLFLFTDAEEVGLLGAQAFLDHPLFEKVGVVLNFEGRGSGGPSILFETSSPDGWLVQRLVGLTPHPMGTSLASAIYPYMPNYTDLTVFRQAGRTAMNFAFIDGFIDYHTRRDDLVTFDRDSLQHHGENMLALVRALASEPPPEPGQDSAAVFFNPVGWTMVHYSQGWAIPLALLLLVLEGLCLGAALRAGRVRASRVALAAGLMLVQALVAAGLVLGLWRLLGWVTGLAAFPQGDAHENRLFLSGLGAVGLAVFALGAWLGGRWLREEEGLLGARLPWLLLMVGSAVLLPGGSYLFAWPLLLTAPLAWPWASRDTWGAWLGGALLGGAATLVTISALLPLSLVVGLSLAGIGALLFVLLLGLLRPPLAIVTRASWGGLSAAAALGALLLLTVGSLLEGPSPARPRPDSLAFWMETDPSRARWLADTRKEAGWPTPLMGESPPVEHIKNVIPWVDEDLLVHDVPPASMPPPRVRRISERQDGEDRELVLHLDNPADAALLRVDIPPPAQVVGATVWGRPVPADALKSNGTGFSLECWQSAPDGVPLTLRLRGTAPVTLHLGAMTFVHPALPEGLRRPAELMASPYGFGFTDTTIVTKIESL